MKQSDIDNIFRKNNAAIIAPAGHGKTEMIVDLVQHSKGKQLLLTHTNAGVDALQKRLKKRMISREKYAIYTIAGFCMKFCDAYPLTANIRDIPISNNDFYSMYYQGAKILFSQEWAKKILKNTYTSVIVDEYQDCMLEQHAIFLRINEFLPVYVLGDPLQAIFGWAGKLVSWNTLEFEVVEIETYPWRWHTTSPELGQFLSEIRKELLPALDGKMVSVPTVPVSNIIKIIKPEEKMSPNFLHELKQFDSVLYITKWAREQVTICQSSGGLFQNDEPQNLNDLYEIAKIIDKKDGYLTVKALFNLFAKCATHVNEEIGSYWQHIKDGNVDFRRIKKNQDFGELITKIVNSHRKEDILIMMDWFKNKSVFRIYRKELFLELIRAIKYSISKEINIFEAAQAIRMRPELQKRYSEITKLSSRTVLSKGLEYDCVIIDLSQAHQKRCEFLATDYYVAMTRARKKIYLITNRKAITLLPC